MNYYHNVQNAKSYIKMCEGYDAEVQLKTLYGIVPKDAKLLELGSGPGNDLTLLKTKYKATGSDTSPIFLNELKKKHADLEILELDALSIKTNGMFDVIYSNKVLHHLNDEDLRASFKRQAAIVEDGGYVYHLIWKIAESPGDGFGLDFIARDENEMRVLMQDYFEIINIESFTEFDVGDSLAILARKK